MIRNWKTMMLLSSSLVLGACSQSEPGISNPEFASDAQSLVQEYTYAPSSGVKASAEVVIDTEISSEARAFITPSNTSGGKAHFWYTSKKGTSEPIYLLFTKVQDGSTATAKGTFTYSKTNAAGSVVVGGKISFEYPQGFVPKAKGQIKLSGLMGGGAKGIATNGAIAGLGNVPDSTLTFVKGQDTSFDYNLPLYFSQVDLDPKDSEHAFEATLSLYGSLMEITVRNDFSREIRPRWIRLTSDAVDFGGTVNLKTLDANGIPSWTSGKVVTQDPTNVTVEPLTQSVPMVSGRRFTLSKLILQPNETKTFYIWGVGNGQTGKVFHLSASENDYNLSANPAAQNQFTLQVKSTKAIAQGKVYPLPAPFKLEGTLIISEFYHSTLEGGESNTIAIANVSKDPVDLSKYHLVYYAGSLYSLPTLQMVMPLSVAATGGYTDYPNGERTSSHLIPSSRVTERVAPIRSLVSLSQDNKMLPSQGVIVINTVNSNIDKTTFAHARIHYSVGKQVSILVKDLDPKTGWLPLRGGAGAAFFIIKGDLPAENSQYYPFTDENMSNVTDNLGLVSKVSLRYSDLSSLSNFFYYQDALLVRRPDKIVPARTLLRADYVPSGKDTERVNTTAGAGYFKLYTRPELWHTTPNVNYAVGTGVVITTSSEASQFGWRVLPSGYVEH